MKISETKEGLILEVFVKPCSKTFRMTVEDDEIVVYCREEPVKGKVNKELIKELSRLFHSKVELASGFASRQKKLLVSGIGKSEMERLLSGR